MQTKVTEDDIFECSDNLKTVASMIIFDLSDKSKIPKDIFLRNCIAKSASLLDSIILLYKRRYFDNTLILFRALIDRLIHVIYIENNDLYQDFRFETLISNFEHVSNARSNEEFKKLLKDPLFQISKEERQNYKQFKKSSKGWSKPDPKQILKENDLGFLYKFGYEYSSRRVHPNYFDGYPEFHVLTGLKPDPFEKFEDQIIINNSLLISAVLINRCISYSSFNFRNIVFDYFSSVINFLNGEGDKSYKMSFLKISNMFREEIELSK
jgi:hypothetical protein